jgi:hypothetical protein
MIAKLINYFKKKEIDGPARISEVVVGFNSMITKLSVGITACDLEREANEIQIQQIAARNTVLSNAALTANTVQENLTKLLGG